MTVARVDGVVGLVGNCGLEDAEPLLRELLGNSVVQVDWNGCTHAHTAIIQILMAEGPVMLGEPASVFLATWIAPLLRGSDKEGGLTPVNFSKKAVPET